VRDATVWPHGRRCFGQPAPPKLPDDVPEVSVLPPVPPAGCRNDHPRRRRPSEPVAEDGREVRARIDRHREPAEGTGIEVDCGQPTRAVVQQLELEDAPVPKPAEQLLDPLHEPRGRRDRLAERGGSRLGGPAPHPAGHGDCEKRVQSHHPRARDDGGAGHEPLDEEARLGRPDSVDEARLVHDELDRSRSKLVLGCDEGAWGLQDDGKPDLARRPERLIDSHADDAGRRRQPDARCDLSELHLVQGGIHHVAPRERHLDVGLQPFAVARDDPHRHVAARDQDVVLAGADQPDESREEAGGVCSGMRRRVAAVTRERPVHRRRPQARNPAHAVAAVSKAPAHR